MSTVFVNVGLSLDGYLAPEGMTLVHWDQPGYKDWGAKWGALMAWIINQRYFRENLKLALPAALLTVVVLGFVGETAPVQTLDPVSPWLIVPYLIVLGLALAGVDVIIVLSLGLVIAGLFGAFFADELGVAAYATHIWEGFESMVEITLLSLLVGFGNGIGSGMVMTLGADYSPSPGRAHFLGVWRLLSDIGATGGPILLSVATAAVSLAAGIMTAGLLGFAAAAVLGYWIPRGNRRLLERGLAGQPDD